MRLATFALAVRASSFLYSPASVRALTTRPMTKNLVVDPFCFRQFQEHPQSEAYGGTVFSQTVEEFEEIVNARFSAEDLKGGYAPFCKHLFLVNDFTGEDARVNVLPVKGNEDKIRTEYAARNDKELPVLQRFISLDAVGGPDKLPRAKYLDLILYSREQIRKENESMGKTAGDEEAPWGIVSIKAQMEDFELPMNPITQMRNALGKEQGGSGIPLTREEYMKSVDYWTANVNVS
mmetsp:Transcript_5694/g.14118  ORF Transcript_5694/g.14118 Transcript_5694/m.14118 type:complete len:235 (-) Transcript_5694:189-893(-)